MSSLPSSPLLTLRLLGPLEIELDGQPLTSQLLTKAQALLVYLAITQQLQPRTSLMVLLWGDSSEEAARMSLRGVLANLRARLDPFLLIERQTVALRPQTNIWVDALAFEQQLTQALAQQDVNGLEEALALYRDELLSGFTVRKAPDFERWLHREQERLRLLVIRGLEALAAIKARAGKLEDAIAQLRRVLALEPWREETHRQLMKLLVRVGQRSAALAQYAACVQALDEELGVEPSSETKALYEEIQQNALTVGVLEQQKIYVEPRLIAEPSATLVGRQVEWQRLLQAWQQASHRQARMVVLAGEAGIGKTRLAEELAAWLRQQGGRVAVAHCYAAEGAMAFTPVIELLRSESVLQTLVELDDVWLAEVARLLPELITRHPQLRVTESGGDSLQRQRFFEALARAVLGGQRSLLLVIDDLQWADRETLEWVRYLLRFAPQARLLLVGTMRSEEVMAEHPLQPLLVTLRRAQQLVEIQLEGLSTAETGMLATQLSGQAISLEEANALYQQTEGNPLFVVETVRAQLESSGDLSGDSAPHDRVVPLPEGIKAVIQARLAQLSPLAQEVAQLAAAVGRAFSLELLAHAGSYSEEELLQSLDELWQRHILEDLSGSGYDFSHARIRDVAYSQISPPRRRLLHGRIAQTMERLFGERLEAMSALVAAHYELAGDVQHAFHAYQRAARFAIGAYGYHEAAESLRRALALLKLVPEDGTRQQQELELQLALGNNLMILKGFSDPETQQAYDRALELCDLTVTDARLFEAIWGLHQVYYFQGDNEKARIAAEQCMHIAQQSGDPELLLQAHYALSTVYLFDYAAPCGLQSVVDHTQQGIELYRSEWHHRHVQHYGNRDPGVCTRFLHAFALWLLGYPEQAAQWAEDAVALATALGHPFTLTMAVGQGAKVYGWRGEYQRVLDAWEHYSQIVAEHDLPAYEAEDFVWRGWALAQINPNTDAIALIEQGIANLQRLEWKVNQAVMLSMLAESYIALGDIESARQAIERGLATTAVTGEANFRPELFRVQGECFRAMGDLKAAERGYKQALALAQQQQVKSLELRAATSLSRLWAEQSRLTQAYELLAGVYNWFTEGFDTADLRRAQEVLRALAP
jgi:DNA-binding SARP family transcriptional activator